MNSTCFLLFPLLLMSYQPGNVRSVPADRVLVWSDEFNLDGAPDASKWGYDLGDGCPNVCGWGNNELEFYTADKKNVRVEKGQLVIEAHKEEKGGKAYTSSRI